MKNLTEEQKANLANQMEQVSRSFDRLANALKEETIKTYFTKTDAEQVAREQYNAEEIYKQTYQTDDND